MRNAVERLAEVKDYHVSLDSLVERSCQLVCKGEKSGITAPLRPETVLAVVEDVVFFKVSHGMADDDMLH